MSLESLAAQIQAFENRSNGRFEVLKREVKGLSTKLESEVQGLNTKLERQMKALNTKIDGVEHCLISAISSSELNLGGRLVGIEHRLEHVEGRLERVEARLDFISGALENAHPHILDHEKRITRLERKAGAVTA